jgi:imidazolonepropionase-like amidohydrolase
MNSRLIITTMLILLPVGGLTAQDADLAIVGGMLIDGNEGTPIQNSVVLVSGERITHVGRVGITPIPAGARVIDANGKTVMPGLIESHGHLMIVGHGEYSEWFPEYEDRIEEIMILSAPQFIHAGVTTVRDVGAPLEPSVKVRDDIAAGKIVGPRLFVSGPFIVRDYGRYEWGKYFQVKVNSVEEARQAAIDILEGGADLLKPWGIIYPEDLKVIVEEAHKRGKTVATHGGALARIRADVEAGVNSIEHWPGGSKSYIEQEALELIINSGTWVVPTWNGGEDIFYWTLDYPERLDNPLLREFLPEDIYQDVRRSLDNFQRLGYFRGGKGRPKSHQKKLMQMYNAGVKIALGTDSGTPMNFHYEAMWQQMKLFVNYGMDPMHVISAATRNGAELLQIADQLGTIEPGKLADIIVVDGNPLMDMMALRDPVRVIKGGQVLK